MAITTRLQVDPAGSALTPTPTPRTGIRTRDRPLTQPHRQSHAGRAATYRMVPVRPVCAGQAIRPVPAHPPGAGRCRTVRAALVHTSNAQNEPGRQPCGPHIPPPRPPARPGSTTVRRAGPERGAASSVPPRLGGSNRRLSPRRPAGSGFPSGTTGGTAGEADATPPRRTPGTKWGTDGAVGTAVARVVRTSM